VVEFGARRRSSGHVLPLSGHTVAQPVQPVAGVRLIEAILGKWRFLRQGSCLQRRTRKKNDCLFLGKLPGAALLFSNYVVRRWRFVQHINVAIESIRNNDNSVQAMSI
jgi:hypothetical protein